ncbi:MAG TPA: peptidoglycan DD-metalloendopeptidase family protein [Xanthobacteraceae bacterium]|nr:peptidoglycan DD-metalloendopeptidase family protein [Xanthobacteraceae bacterium]
MLRIGSIAALCGVFLVIEAAAGEMQPPRVTRAAVDWNGAAAALGEIAALQAVHSADAAPSGAAVGRLNAATGAWFSGIAATPVPVLLPFDTDAFLHDRAAGGPAGDPAAYSFGLGPPAFFAPGPAGYDATYRFRLSALPDLAGIRFERDVVVAISGSLLIYELDPPAPGAGKDVPALAADFPGIRRILTEDHVRYSFVRFGVPYVVALPCFDGPSARYRRMACRDADRVLVRFIRLLRIAGGAPQLPARTLAPPPARPAATSPSFTYNGPGRLAPGAGFHGNGGRTDFTVYSAIRFPLAEAPVFVNTQRFARRNAGRIRSYPWRDNFCERRAFHVGQCPAGLGHQGEDILAAPCSRTSPGADRCSAHKNDVVAVRDGVIMRESGQEAVYLVVNTPTEHLRVRYLHMQPKLLDAAGVVSGRAVRAGEVIGQIGNFDGHENGTSYHLHFDIQVPTRAGWVFVNPYMTLVASYERLIGGRGVERPDLVASAPSAVGDASEPSTAPPITLAEIRQAILPPGGADTAGAPAHHCGAAHRHAHGCAGVHARGLRYGRRRRAAALPPLLQRGPYD